MIESVWVVLKAALLPINMPFTILLGVVVLYWLLVILGALDFDMGGHDVDVSMDGHDIDAGHDADAGSHDVGDGHSITAFQSMLQFLHIGDAPMMIVVSVMAVIAWGVAVLSNVYLNPGGSWLLALVYLVPNGVFTVVATHYLLRPLAKAMRSMNEDQEKSPPVVGRVAEVTTSEVTEKFGMALLQVKGAPLAIQIRSTKGEPIKKGDQVLVINEDRKNNTFEVVKYQQTELEV
jgi:hypothetical protein